ncbi:radical SAM protein [Chryseobacterium phosphatilyticum]|uniref:Radical SAM protein n=1 Tax=Chryseobacterium phosphatilyticum TaxID=475075 RepID=A0A316X943_9FLAO|nr:radical SAM protein [Chryseobacterium phosphatilyticum]PWN69286.1 radical SAM protein [Chryseobacterium phosphatilyticum]
MVTSFVLKVASRCNLNCSYCYMYNLGDKTYLKQPKFMSIHTIKTFAEKLSRYSTENGLKAFQIVFHGGEPLLFPKEFYKESVRIFTETLNDSYFDFVIQTNGVGLDEDWYALFDELNIRVGISMDGPKEYHDKYRVFHNGKGSYDEVRHAIQIGLDKGMHGVLSVVNLNITPRELYQEFKNLNIPSFNLLLPDGHFDKLPDDILPEKINTHGYTPFADWLIELFQIWKNDPDRPNMRFFKTLIQLVAGEEVGDQMVGLKKNGVAVVETNGNLEVADSIRACYEGITRNNINIHTHEIAAILEDPLFDVYINSHQMVNAKCLHCPIYEICGGGFLLNRYSNEKGFDNPTIYCHDMIKLVSYIQNDLIDSLPEEVCEEMQLTRVSYDDIVQELENINEGFPQQEIKEKLLAYSLA